MKLLLLLAISTFCLAAADATGKWMGSFSPRGGNEGPALLLLKQEGDKITGTVGPDTSDRRDIQNGTVADGTITFEVSIGEGMLKFVLKQDGEQMNGEANEQRGQEKVTAEL